MVYAYAMILTCLALLSAQTFSPLPWEAKEREPGIKVVVSSDLLSFYF